jgi:sigma-B regulation protein RsbU (phosphoserine phosphatase)
MLFWIIAVTMPIYAVALYMSYEVTARRLQAGAERDLDELAARLAARLDAVIRPIEGGVRTVAHQLEEVDPPPAQYSQRILGILRAWPDVYGSTIAVEVGSPGASPEPFAPYFFRRGDTLAFADLAQEKYAYQRLPWYRRAADGGQAVWSMPYFDAGGGNTWMVTYSVPFFRRHEQAGRIMAGVVTADLDLNWVKGAAVNAALGPIGMGWLSSPPAGGDAFSAPIGATAARIVAFDDSMDQDAIRKLGEGMLGRGVSFALLPRGATSQPAYLAVRSLETLGWRVMLVIPKAQLLDEAGLLLSRQLWLGAIGLVLLIAAISIVAAGITRPIRALAVTVGAARAEELDQQLSDAPRRDEIGVLTDALRRMASSLREHIQSRAQTLAEQARLDHDLQIAASIQQSMLPRSEAASDISPAVQVAAALLPAKQVGGDLYDYFRLGDGKLLLATGDVSDKGIPAALFMARLSALLRVKGAASESPDLLLSALNTNLAQGNDACMFATLSCCVLDVATGRIRCASAGHEPPLLRTAEGDVISLPIQSGPALAIEAAADYPLWEGCVAPGDTLVFFTDGVTEAQAQDASLFGRERLSELLRTAHGGQPAAFVKRVVDTVSAHAADFHVTDDLTVLAIRWCPSGVTFFADDKSRRWCMQVDPSNAGIEQAQRWLRAILAAREVAPECIGDAELIAEELLTNIVRAAGQNRGRELTLDCALVPAGIALTIRDDGPRFDPFTLAAPDLDADILDRPRGGLGIHIVKELADECSYARVDGWNVVKVRVRSTPCRSKS